MNEPDVKEVEVFELWTAHVSFGAKQWCHAVVSTMASQHEGPRFEPGTGHTLASSYSPTTWRLIAVCKLALSVNLPVYISPVMRLGKESYFYELLSGIEQLHVRATFNVIQVQISQNQPQQLQCRIWLICFQQSPFVGFLCCQTLSFWELLVVAPFDKGFGFLLSLFKKKRS